MRIVFVFLAVISLIVAAIGIIVPGLPTVEFLILAVWLASKGSPKLEQWIIENRFFGPVYANWSNGKGLPLKIKIFSTLMILVGLGIMIRQVQHIPSIIVTAIAMSIGIIFIWLSPISKLK